MSQQSTTSPAPGARDVRTPSPLARRFSPRMLVMQVCAIAVAIFLTGIVFFTLNAILGAQAQATRTHEAFEQSQGAIDELQATSDYLTEEARAYATNGDTTHLNNYLKELEEDKRRDRAVNTLRSQASSEKAIRALELGSKFSDELDEVEKYALKLAATAYGLAELPEALNAVVLSDADSALSNEEKLARCETLLFGGDYATAKMRIREQGQECSELLVGALSEELTAHNAHLQSLIMRMNACVLLLLFALLFVVAITRIFLQQPMTAYEKNILEGEPLVPAGAQELRHLVAAYNEMYTKNNAVTETLSFGARNDALTGVLNRRSFNQLLTLHKQDSALILIDVDNFKEFNDSYGHDMGDAILIEVAATLFASFRSSDHICRIGGDEFAVIMVGATPALRDVIEHKIHKTATFLRETENGLPAATISVGIAFGTPTSTDEGLFQAADDALYETKRRGRDGLTFAEE